MNPRIWLPLLVVMLVMVACTPAPELRDEAFLNDTSLLTGEPCSAPCWQDLIPGESAWGLAQDTIANSDAYREVDTESNRQTGEVWIDFAFTDGPQCCRLYTVDGETLSRILLLVSPQMTVAEVVAAYGEPTYLTAQAETSEQAYVALIYPDIPMVIYAFAENLTDSEINADNAIIGMVYMDATELDKVLETQSLYNWDGYGALGDIIDGEFDLTAVPTTEE